MLHLVIEKKLRARITNARLQKYQVSCSPGDTAYSADGAGLRMQAQEVDRVYAAGVGRSVRQRPLQRSFLEPQQKRRSWGRGSACFRFAIVPEAILAVFPSSLRGAHARQLLFDCGSRPQPH